MTSAIPSSSQEFSSDKSNTHHTPTHSISPAVPAQLPVRSSGAIKTASTPSPAGASAPAQNAKSATDSHMNGSMAQGGSQYTQNGGNVNNGSGPQGDHGRKPSVVINASGASGYTPNGGPVSANGRPPIVFGSQVSDSPASAPFQAQNANLSTPSSNPRATSPAHSPTPIPQPSASGGRPPSGMHGQINGLAFGSAGPDNEMMRSGSQAGTPMHERHASSQSMQSELSNQGVNAGRPPFTPQGQGRGRGFNGNPPYMGSPSASYRPMPGPQGRGMSPYPGQQRAPSSPYMNHSRPSPGPMPVAPNMPGGPMNHQQMPQYPGYAPQQGYAPQMYPGYDPNTGYYPPYYNGYPQPGPSPGPQYPGAAFRPPPPHMAPPFNPGTPGVDMARTASHGSSRPPSSIGHGSHTPTPSQQGISQAPMPQQSAASSFVRPKKTSAIKITDADGNAVNFNKPAAASSTTSQPKGPVIVSTPNASTPPPRVPSAQHNRTESKATKSSEETKTAFAEQVKRQIEEEKRKAQEKEDAAKAGEKKAEDKAEAPKEAEKPAAEKASPAAAPVKEAEAAAEKSAAVAADDKEGAKAADAKADEAKSGAADEEDEAARKKREEDEEFERQIAEMEAREKEEEERERAYNEKKAKAKAEAEAREKEKAAHLNTDEELKRQEREAEERELARERERNGETKAEEADAEAKKLFASLKKPTLGPGANAQDNETSEDSSNEQSAPQSAPPRAGAQKPKPAHLKLETNKAVERAEPTPGMQALKSARFLALQEEPEYPSGFKSPNPALNQSAPKKGHAYDRDFLLQFQSIFKEKPSVDWDQKVRETLGPGDDSARPQTARTPSSAGGRQASRGAGGFPGGAMGAFGSGAQRAPVGSGTTSAERFAASMGAPPRPGQPGMVRAPSNLGIGAPGNMSRTNSLQMGAMGGSRQPSQRGPGRGGSKRDDRTHSRRENAEAAAKMPLTAGQAVAPLDKSASGWKASSVVGGNTGPAVPDPTGNVLMAPDMVQRKVKAALNKMTPEKFEKISDQILEIAAQSKHETDGRTLRQVIQLTFEKACDEAHWAGMYAQFCHKMLTTMSPDIRDDTIKDKAGNPVIGGGLFRKYLLNRCQEEFERGWQANLPDKPEGESQEAALLSDEYYIAAAAKRRGLGLIQFIGQLYKLRMLTVRIMHECVLKLLNFEGDPDEAAIENLTTLLTAIGATMDQEEQGRPCIAMYFSRINNVLENAALASRPRFMLLDLIDLRKAGWRGKNDSKGPKTIQEIHAEAEAAAAKAEAERQRTSRGGAGGPGGRPAQGRGDARFANGPPPPVDYSRTNVAMDDLKKLSQRSQNRQSMGGSMGPGGGLGPSMLGARTGSRRGLSGMGPGSGNSTRTSTPPVDAKKDEPAAQNAFSALAALDGAEGPEDVETVASPPPANATPAATEEAGEAEKAEGPEA